MLVFFAFKCWAMDLINTSELSGPDSPSTLVTVSPDENPLV